MASGNRMIVRSEVATDSAGDFEKLLSDKVIPAVDRARKDLAERWQVYRGEDQDDRAVFVFLLEGDDPAQWELGPVLTDALGSEEGREVLEQFERLLLQEQQVVRLRPVRD